MVGCNQHYGGLLPPNMTKREQKLFKAMYFMFTYYYCACVLFVNYQGSRRHCFSGHTYNRMEIVGYLKSKLSASEFLHGYFLRVTYD